MTEREEDHPNANKLYPNAIPIMSDMNVSHSVSDVEEVLKFNSK